MSTEFDKDISDLSPDCTNNKTRIDFYFRLVKWPKLAINNVFRNIRNKSFSTIQSYKKNGNNKKFAPKLTFLNLKIHIQLIFFTLKVDILALFDSYFWPFSKSHVKIDMVKYL